VALGFFPAAAGLSAAATGSASSDARHNEDNVASFLIYFLLEVEAIKGRFLTPNARR
jgi:hypothetical protein